MWRQSTDCRTLETLVVGASRGHGLAKSMITEKAQFTRASAGCERLVQSEARVGPGRA